jgi:hypothetical protein
MCSLRAPLRKGKIGPKSPILRHTRPVVSLGIIEMDGNVVLPQEGARASHVAKKSADDYCYSPEPTPHRFSRSLTSLNHPSTHTNRAGATPSPRGRPIANTNDRPSGVTSYDV